MYVKFVSSSQTLNTPDFEKVENFARKHKRLPFVCVIYKNRRKKKWIVLILILFYKRTSVESSSFRFSFGVTFGVFSSLWRSSNFVSTVCRPSSSRWSCTMFIVIRPAYLRYAVRTREFFRFRLSVRCVRAAKSHFPLSVNRLFQQCPCKCITHKRGKFHVLNFRRAVCLCSNASDFDS